MRDSFIFYKSFYDSIKELDISEQIKIYQAIFKYQFENKKTDLDGISKVVFTLILPQLEANNKRYENGKKGGAPKGNKNALKINQKSTEKQPKINQKSTKNQPNNNVNVNVNENVNVNNNNIILEKNNKKRFFEDDNLNDLFLEFLEVRKKLKAVNSDRAINCLLNTLKPYDDEIKYKMIEQSIVKSWKDVYVIKEEKKKRDTEEEVLKYLEENN